MEVAFYAYWEGERERERRVLKGIGGGFVTFKQSNAQPRFQGANSVVQ